MKIEMILDKIIKRTFKNCTLKLRFNKFGMLIHASKEQQLRGDTNED